jgi:putative aldouronate transport system permease protein
MPVSAIQEQATKAGKKAFARNTLLGYLWYHRYIYLLLVPAIIYYVTFHYLPMYGATIAFKNFNIMKGILRSPWAGLKYFEVIFALDKFWKVLRNTITISLLRIAFGFPVPIVAALLLNEMRSVAVKRTIQTLIYLPHFISWVILGGILVNLLSVSGGAVNQMIIRISGEPIGFLTDPKYFRGTIITSMIWKEYGWGTVLYLATLAGIPPELYESAAIDGASRLQRVWHITLPHLVGVISVLLILRIGRMMQAGFEQIFVLYHPAVYSVIDILDTYVYRIGLADGKFSQATAVGLFRSTVNFLLLITANKIAKSAGQHGIY